MFLTRLQQARLDAIDVKKNIGLLAQRIKVSTSEEYATEIKVVTLAGSIHRTRSASLVLIFSPLILKRHSRDRLSFTGLRGCCFGMLLMGFHLRPFPHSLDIIIPLGEKTSLSEKIVVFSLNRRCQTSAHVAT